MPSKSLIVVLFLCAVARPLHGQDGAARLDSVGFLPLPGFNADVWAHEGFAYVGSMGTDDPQGGQRLCPATGVRIIDLADPTRPALAGAVAQIPATSQEDVMVVQVNTAEFQGDLLAVGIQACVRGSDARRGIDLWDVTNPRAPVPLGFWASGPFGASGARGVHELHLFQQNERVYVAAAVPGSEGLEGRGDFRLVDVTDPRHPVQVTAWGALADGRYTLRPGDNVFAHSAHTNASGDLLILSYWDAGAILLDISDPEQPMYLGRTVYPAGAKGDTHSVALARDDTLLLVADEDEDPSDGTWGFLRIWDITNRRDPVEVGRFATPHALQFPPERQGLYTVHNPIVRGNLAFLSWYSDGVRVVDISSPQEPTEVAAFVPPDTVDPFGAFPNTAMVWGVALERDLVLASDTHAGLYVLRFSPPGAQPGPTSPRRRRA